MSLTRQFCDGVFLQALSRTGKRIMVEKSVEHARHLAHLVEIYPESRIVHLVRDGRDVALSIAEAAAHWRPDWPKEPADALEMWRAYNASILDGLALVPPEQVLRLRYESLVERTAEELIGVFAFLGTERPHDVAEIVASHTIDRLRERLPWRKGRFFGPGRPGRWRDAAPWKMSPATEAMLVALGYDAAGSD